MSATDQSEDTEVVNAVTAAMREADRVFEKVGGSTRHHVRDCLLPVLNRNGWRVVPATPESSSAAVRAEGEPSGAAESRASAPSHPLGACGDDGGANCPECAKKFKIDSPRPKELYEQLLDENSALKREVEQLRIDRDSWLRQSDRLRDELNRTESPSPVEPTTRERSEGAPERQEIERLKRVCKGYAGSERVLRADLDEEFKRRTAAEQERDALRKDRDEWEKAAKALKVLHDEQATRAEKAESSLATSRAEGRDEGLRTSLTVQEINEINRRLTLTAPDALGSERKHVADLQWKLVEIGQQIEDRARSLTQPQPREDGR